MATEKKIVIITGPNGAEGKFRGQNSAKFRGHNTNFCWTPSEDDRLKENSQKISTASPDSGVAGGAINVAVEELTKQGLQGRKQG